MAFCRWLTQRGHADGWLQAEQSIRLPSEAEWEKAARGTDGRIYPWGDEWEPERANTLACQIGRPTVVGCFPDGASPYAALDMSGNVWEWTTSAYQPYDADHSVVDVIDRVGVVLRGGAFDSHPWDVRCAVRDRARHTTRVAQIGLRVVRVTLQPPDSTT